MGEAELIVSQIEGTPDNTLLAGEAVAAAKELMGLFPAKAFNDVAIFSKGLAGLLSAYDRKFVVAVLSPVDGIATRTKFALTLAEVKEALEAEKNKRLSILSVAKWTIREHSRREEERVLLERDRKPLTPEQMEARQRQLATLLGPRNSDGMPAKLETENG